MQFAVEIIQALLSAINYKIPIIIPVYFVTCVNPAGNVIFKVLLLPLFTENEDGAFTLSTDCKFRFIGSPIPLATVQCFRS